MDEPPLSPIGPEQAALLEGPVSIIVGSRDESLRPHLTRALGCRLDADRRRATVLLPRAAGAQVLADLQANGRIAVVASRPTTNRTLQIKGSDATLQPCTAQDEALAAAHLEGFIDEITRLGFQAEVARTVHRHDTGIAAVGFTIVEAYEQTPGPQAGAPLPTAAAPGAPKTR
jgi:Pyridoxamine 5'-phosphate oxidase